MTHEAETRCLSAFGHFELFSAVAVTLTAAHPLWLVSASQDAARATVTTASVVFVTLCVLLVSGVTVLPPRKRITVSQIGVRR